MTGTTKQLAWVEEIKANAISNLTNNIDRMSSEPTFAANVKTYKLMVAVVEAVFAAQTDAEKIINRREMFAPAALFATCDRWAEMISSGKATIEQLAAKNGLKNYKEA